MSGQARQQRAEVAEPFAIACKAQVASVPSLVSGLLDTRAWPTLLLDGSLSILASNSSAQKLFEEQDDWLMGSCGELRNRDQGVTAELQALVKAVTDAEPVTTRAVHAIDRAGEKQTLVTIARIEHHEEHTSAACRSSASLVLLTVNDGQRRQTEKDIELLKFAFGFTPSEAKLALALLDGLSLQDFSEYANVRISTARWHLGNVFSKAHCTSQRDLVRLLLSLIDG